MTTLYSEQNSSKKLIETFTERSTFLSDRPWNINDMNDISKIHNNFNHGPRQSNYKYMDTLFKVTSNIDENISDIDYVQVQTLKITALKFELINKNLVQTRPSSIKSEQCLSICSQNEVPIRGRMSHERLGKLMFLKLKKKLLLKLTLLFPMHFDFKNHFLENMNILYNSSTFKRSFL